MFLVTGGRGKTGARVASRLEGRGLAVRRAARTSDHVFEWMAPTSWPSALEGTKAVYLSFQPDLAMAGAAGQIGAFCNLAAKLGVERLVMLSGRGESEAVACEDAALSAGIPTTLLRCSWFMQNFSEGLFADGVTRGLLSLPVGSVHEPFVDAEDVADVAEAALLHPGHAGQCYELTGPRLLSFADVIRSISRATDREIRFQTISLAAFIQELEEAGLDRATIGLLQYLFSEVLDGRNASLGDGVQRALGRSPTDVDEFARRLAAGKR